MVFVHLHFVFDSASSLLSMWGHWLFDEKEEHTHTKESVSSLCVLRCFDCFDSVSPISRCSFSFGCHSLRHFDCSSIVVCFVFGRCVCVCVRVFVKQHDYGRLHNRICEISCVNRLQSHPRISSSCVKCSVNELRTKVIDTCYVGKWPFRLGWWSTARKSMKFNAMRSFVCLLMLCTHKHTKCGWNISVLLVILRWTWFIKSLCWWLCVRWANAKPQYLFIRGFIHVFFICCRCFTLKEKIMHFFRVLYIVAFILETMTCGS